MEGSIHPGLPKMTVGIHSTIVVARLSVSAVAYNQTFLICFFTQQTNDEILKSRGQLLCHGYAFPVILGVRRHI